MQTPFKLSLQDYESLWRPTTYAEETKIGNGMLDEALQRSRELKLRGNSYWVGANELRHQYLESDPAKSRFYLACMVRLIGHHPTVYEHQYMLDIMSGWMRGKNDFQAVKNLLQFAVESRGLSEVVCSCLLEAAQICVSHQMPTEARRICAACFLFPTDYSLLLVIHELYRRLIKQSDFLTAIPNSESLSKFNPLLPQNAHSVSCFLADIGLNNLTEKILSASQSTIKPQIKEANQGIQATSRLGGLPDVEEGWQWPKRLEFLAQLNLEELAPYDLNGVLPKRGLLRFFMMSLAHGWEDDGFCVEFYDGDLTRLQKAQAPDFLTDMNDVNYFDNEDVIYKEAELEFGNGIQVSVYEADFDDRMSFYEAESVTPLCAAVLDINQRFAWGYQVLGTVSRYAFIPEDVEKNEWVLLLAIDSAEDETGMMFSDAGTVYFYMRRDDLAASRFNRVQVTMTNG